MASVVINVEGMTCKHCKMTVESALKNLNGISRAEVNLDKNQVFVEFNEAEVNFEKMKETIKDKGYDVIN